MSGSIPRRTSTDEPTPAERRAQAWHDKQHPEACQSCWCCCTDCRANNPHQVGAALAALHDIAARIADAAMTARPPRPNQDWKRTG